MSRVSRRGAAAARGALVCAIAGLLASSASATAAGPPNEVRLGSAPTAPAGARTVGSLPSPTQLHLAVTLRPRDPAGLAAYASGVATPGSSVYHQYLTVAQFAARFGATAAQVDSVRTWLKSNGVAAGALSANGLSLPLTASAGALSHALSVSFSRYTLPGGRAAFANDAAPLVAANVSGVVQDLVGLDTLNPPEPKGLQISPGVAHASPRVATGGPQPCPGATSTGERTADQLASAYRFSSLYGAGDLGSGQTVALYELERNIPSDIPAYQACYGTSASVSYSTVDGGAAAFQSGDRIETELDVEDALSLAPKASFIVYQGPNTNAGAYDTYSAIVTQNKAKVISTSWGLCERFAGSGSANAENTLFQEAATQGQSVFAASGDNGSQDCYPFTRGLAVDDPASQPYVTGVGGTTLTATGPPPTQSVWNNSIGAGGGGLSGFWKMPSYQSGAPASLGVINALSSGSLCAAGAGSYCREVPDVSAAADPNTGYAVLYNGRWTGVGGTSGAAPTWAAFAALVNASSSCSSGPIGFANPALYSVAGSAFSSAFSDITAGNNDFLRNAAGRYPAQSGYDMASGLGTPVGSSLAGALCGGAGSGPATVTLTNPGNQTGTIGTSEQLQITASDSDGGSLSYSATGLPSGLSINSATGLIFRNPDHRNDHQRDRQGHRRQRARLKRRVHLEHQRGFRGDGQHH